MYPTIFEYNGFVISSYGFMLMTAFLVCNHLLKKHLYSINVDGKIADDIIFYAAIGGILGSKIYYIIEEKQLYETYISIGNIFKGIFTLNSEILTLGISQFGGGLVFLGGLMGGTLGVTWVIQKQNLNWLKMSDIVAPLLILGYGIGRIGCFLVGDDYGIPTHLPWGVSFVNGLPPTTYQSFQFNYPWISLDGFEPGLLTVYPTQLMETVLAVFIFGYLWSRREKIGFEGQLFFTYLVFAGLERFFIEFIRTNIKYISVFTGSQIISIFMILIGVYFLRFNQQVNVPQPSD